MILQDNVNELGERLRISRYETAELISLIVEGIYGQNELDLPRIRARINCLSEGRVEGGFIRGNEIIAMTRFEDFEPYTIFDLSDTNLPILPVRHSIHI